MRATCFFTIVVGAAACADTPPPSSATGELGAWSASESLPVARANHCSAAIDDWLLVIGGNRSEGGAFVTTDEIHAARLVDGVLGPWHLAGRTASPVTECAATSDGRQLYIVGGLYENEPDRAQVWTATLDDAGLLDGMRSHAQLPASIISSEAAARDGELLVIETKVPQSGDMTRTLRYVNGAWSELDWGIGFRAQAQIAFTDTATFLLGGYKDPAMGTVASVHAMHDGVVRDATALPAPIGFGEAVAVDDWLFVIGGRAQVFGAPGQSSVYAAPITGDGAIGDWQALPALPAARTNHELTLVGDHLVLTGGAAMGPGDASVWTAQVRY